jgi:EmrB/QacA subfamily drug resistance transporter
MAAHTTKLENTDRSHKEIMIIIGALMSAMLLAALDQTIVSTALPRIAQELNGLNHISWVATSYLLTSAVVTPLYGKISDLFGRKKIFLVAISIFLIGSILCGFSQNMGQLIVFRGIQGVGGGGLFALIFAIIGDIIPPRQRGRYQGYFGAVFGVSSVVGPLLGGFFTDHLSWRWVFYINIPIGLFSMFIIARYLHLPVHRTEHKIDFAGAGLLATAIVSLLLVTVWGGNQYAWVSPEILSLGALSILSTALFIRQEQRAAEPILPLRLFRNDIFTVSSLLALVSGLVMFAAILYLPVYQQLVRGYSATKSGLLMLPLVIGLFAGNIGSGRIISQTGKYRKFPLAGTLIITLGLWLFSHIGLTTNQWLLSVWMLVLGLGIGLFMQVTTLAVQNTVERRDMGTATSTIVFFRNMGSSFGAAIFGTVLTSRLAHYLQQTLGPSASHINVSNLEGGASQLQSINPEVFHAVLQSFTLAFRDLFLWAVPFALLGFVIALFLREEPLRTSNHEAPSPSEE